MTEKFKLRPESLKDFLDIILVLCIVAVVFSGSTLFISAYTHEVMIDSLYEPTAPLLFTFELTNENGLYWYVDAYNCMPYESNITAGKLAVRCLVPNPDYDNPSNLIWDNVYQLYMIGPVPYRTVKGQ